MAVVLVTGVARELGARFARSLAADDSTRVIGVDSAAPHHDLGRAGFVRADVGSPAVGRLINAEAVDTVVHLALVASQTAQNRSWVKEINVLGAMQLFAACQQSTSFRKLVVQSSISVYGASSKSPARFTEDTSDAHQPQSGPGKDAVEVETYARGLARRRPDSVVTTLRLANLMSRGHDSQITRHLTLPVVPRVLGFDPRMQFLHPSDAVAALELVTRRDVPGTFNVAADDVITLNQALGMLGRPSVGVPRQALPWSMPAVRRTGLVRFAADDWDALTHGRVMDVSRFTEAAGFQVRHTTREAFAEFAAGVPAGAMSADRVDRGLARAGELAHRLRVGLRGEQR